MTEARTETVSEAEEIDRVANALFDAIAAGDVDGVRDLYAEDVQVWHNVTDKAQTRDENLALLKMFTGKMAELRYDEIDRRFYPGGFVQRHVLRGKTKSGQGIEVPVCIMIDVAASKITRIYEYLDQSAIAGVFD